MMALLKALEAERGETQKTLKGEMAFVLRNLNKDGSKTREVEIRLETK